MTRGIGCNRLSKDSQGYFRKRPRRTQKTDLRRTGSWSVAILIDISRFALDAQRDTTKYKGHANPCVFALLVFVPWQSRETTYLC